MSSSTKVLLGVAGGALLLLVMFVAFSGGGVMGGMGRMMARPTMGGGFMLLWLIFLVALIALVVWLLMRPFSNQRGENRPQAREGSAEHILRERFARGEIDAEEYEHSLEALGGKTGAESERTDER